MRAAMAVSSFRRDAIVVEQVREQKGSIESRSSLKVGAEAHARPELAGDRTCYGRLQRPQVPLWQLRPSGFTTKGLKATKGREGMSRRSMMLTGLKSGSESEGDC